MSNAQLRKTRTPTHFQLDIITKGFTQHIHPPVEQATQTTQRQPKVISASYENVKKRNLLYTKYDNHEGCRTTKHAEQPRTGARFRARSRMESAF